MSKIMNTAYNMDCMDALRQIPDKYFSLAVVDPPYGGGGGGTPSRTEAHSRPPGLTGDRADALAGALTATIKATRTGGTWAAKYQTRIGGIFDRDIRTWDVAPPPEYFIELARVSRNQVIWGGNYFALPPTRCFLVWRKVNIPAEGFTMAPIEYAWTSFSGNALYFEASSAGSSQEKRFHPTQKPVSLYSWIYGLFARPGDAILDTHLGSGSSRLAAYDAGLDFVGFEIDKVYFDLQEARFEAHAAQVSMLDTMVPIHYEQEALWDVTEKEKQ